MNLIKQSILFVGLRYCLLLGVIVAVGIWWQKNRESTGFFSKENYQQNYHLTKRTTETAELKLTDISKMQSLLTPKPEMTPLEKQGG